MNKKGFTLIELLITIMIIMIIAGYALFAYIDSLREAENTRAKATLEVIHSGLERAMLEGWSWPISNDPNTPRLENADFNGPCAPGLPIRQTLARCGFIPRLNFDDMSYQFVCVPNSSVEENHCIMFARPDRNVGARFEAPYCARIDLYRGGKAVDGTLGNNTCS